MVISPATPLLAGVGTGRLLSTRAARKEVCVFPSLTPDAVLRSPEVFPSTLAGWAAVALPPLARAEPPVLAAVHGVSDWQRKFKPRLAQRPQYGSKLAPVAGPATPLLSCTVLPAIYTSSLGHPQNDSILVPESQNDSARFQHISTVSCEDNETHKILLFCTGLLPSQREKAEACGTPPLSSLPA